jgi:hypothetical protein
MPGNIYGDGPRGGVFGPLAMTMLRSELIVFYDCSLLMVLQPDGSYDVARIE